MPSRASGIARPTRTGKNGAPKRVSESWHEERDRLVRLLRGVESGAVTHVDHKDLRQLQATNAGNIAWIRSRISELNDRLGTGD